VKIIKVKYKPLRKGHKKSIMTKVNLKKLAVSLAVMCMMPMLAAIKKDLKKNTVIFASMIFFVLLLCGCSKEYKNYTRAKRYFKEATLSNIPKYRIYNFINAADLFKELGEYKASKELYEETVYLTGLDYFKQMDIENADKYFSKSMDYKRAVDKAIDEVSINRDTLYNVVEKWITTFNTETGNFWQVGKNSNNDKDAMNSVVMVFLRWLYDYRDAKELHRRCEEAKVMPVMDEKTFEQQSKQVGTYPQARTIVFVVGGECVPEKAFERYAADKFCCDMKAGTMGNLFFTTDVTQACATVRFTINNYFARTVHYTNGVIGDEYNSNLTIDVRSANGKILFHKSLWKEGEVPIMISEDFKDRVVACGDFTNTANDDLWRDKLYPEFLKALEKYFVEMGNK
jgi:tetratricopeptide (TPR) repeat protein